jgi:hypothetical protein
MFPQVLLISIVLSSLLVLTTTQTIRWSTRLKSDNMRVAYNGIYIDSSGRIYSAGSFKGNTLTFDHSSLLLTNSQAGYEVCRNRYSLFGTSYLHMNRKL